MALNRNLPPVRTDQFAMVPRVDIPRSTFATQHTYKSTFPAGYLIPVLCEEVLPGDVWQGRMHCFARLATPVWPVMDNIYIESFFFFVPNRLVWDNWVRMMGERKNPNDSISYVVPTVSSPAGGFQSGNIADFFGLPVAGQVPGTAVCTVNALPFRAYALIWNEWFRDQNLLNAAACPTGDGPDSPSLYSVLRRGKRHDYFTSALPWPTKNNDVPNIPLSGTVAPVKGIGFSPTQTTAAITAGVYQKDHTQLSGQGWQVMQNPSSFWIKAEAVTPNAYPDIWADLSQVGSTLNALRLAVATQQLLERDARGGTRYVEILRNHFGVFPQDLRMQRPEYIGGGQLRMQTQAIAQTSSPQSETDTPIGNLGAASAGSDSHSFSCTASEHGFILGIVHVRGDLTYQQGVHRQWTRSSRYDYYWPAFAFLGEQVVRNDEIFFDGTSADSEAFGYQERWAEYRYKPSRITGKFRSGVSGSMDDWHLAEQFATRPALNGTFINDAPPFSRILAAGSAAVYNEILWDSVFSISVTRALPVRSVPGLTRF